MVSEGLGSCSWPAAAATPICCRAATRAVARRAISFLPPNALPLLLVKAAWPLQSISAILR